MFKIDMKLLDQSKNWMKGNWSLLFKNKQLFLIDHEQNKISNLMSDLGPQAIDNKID